MGRASFTAIERERALFSHEASPMKEMVNIDWGERAVKKEEHSSPPNKIQYMVNKSMTTRVGTNPVFESVQQPITVENINDWKILTIRQLKHTESRKNSMKPGSKSRGRRGIEVSMSEGKRRCVSVEKAAIGRSERRVGKS
jgi:hypothetical protein